MKRAATCAVFLLAFCIGLPQAQKTKSYPVLLTDQESRPYAIEIYGRTNAKEPMVKITWDGKVTFGKDYNPDKAAKIFWETTGNAAPCHAENGNH